MDKEVIKLCWLINQRNELEKIRTSKRHKRYRILTKIESKQLYGDKKLQSLLKKADKEHDQIRAKKRKFSKTLGWEIRRLALKNELYVRYKLATGMVVMLISKHPNSDFTRITAEDFPKLAQEYEFRSVLKDQLIDNKANV